MFLVVFFLKEATREVAVVTLVRSQVV